MKSIQTLIKLQQRDLDDKRRILKNLLDEEALLEAKKEEFKSAIIEEQKRAQADMESAFTLPAFIQTTRRNIITLEDRIILTRKKVEQVRTVITAIFQELKRYEIYDDLKETEARAKESQREQGEMDEMGLRGFIYKDLK